MDIIELSEIEGLKRGNNKTDALLWVLEYSEVLGLNSFVKKKFAITYYYFLRTTKFDFLLEKSEKERKANDLKLLKDIDQLFREKESVEAENQEFELISFKILIQLVFFF